MEKNKLNETRFLNVDIYQRLVQYQYPDLDEVEKSLSEENPHFFIPVTDDEIENASQKLFKRIGIQFPTELVSFWRAVGAGELFAAPPNKNIGRYEILDPQSILGIYFAEDDLDEIYNTIRRDAQEQIENNKLLAFCAFSEYSALFIATEPDTDGKYAVYYSADKKIASSFEEYIHHILEKPDYFI